jgi:HEAT repeat protein
MSTNSDWNDIRAGLQGNERNAVYQAAIAVGQIQAEEIPRNIADLVIRLFRHADPEVRVEAVRAIGVHWRLSYAAEALSDVIEHEEDSIVRLSAISGLGALGTEHSSLRCFASRVLATAVLNEKLDEYARVVSYLEVLLVERRVSFEEYISQDLYRADSLASLDLDLPWLRELAQRHCPELHVKED